MEASIVINKEPAFQEVWFEGYVEYSDTKYYFWLVDPQRVDENGEEYEIDVKWFYKRVPMEVRAMSSNIIEAFKNKQQ